MILLFKHSTQTPTNDITDVLKQLRHLTSKEVMQIINCSKNHLTKLIRNGELVYFKKGNFSYSFPPEQFTLEYIQKKQEQKKSKLGLKKG